MMSDPRRSDRIRRLGFSDTKSLRVSLKSRCLVVVRAAGSDAGSPNEGRDHPTKKERNLEPCDYVVRPTHVGRVHAEYRRLLPETGDEGRYAWNRRSMADEGTGQAADHDDDAGVQGGHGYGDKSHRHSGPPRAMSPDSDRTRGGVPAPHNGITSAAPGNGRPRPGRRLGSQCSPSARSRGYPPHVALCPIGSRSGAGTSVTGPR